MRNNFTQTLQLALGIKDILKHSSLFHKTEHSKSIFFGIFAIFMALLHQVDQPLESLEYYFNFFLMELSLSHLIPISSVYKYEPCKNSACSMYKVLAIHYLNVCQIPRNMVID